MRKIKKNLVSSWRQSVVYTTPSSKKKNIYYFCIYLGSDVLNNFLFLLHMFVCILCTQKNRTKSFVCTHNPMYIFYSRWKKKVLFHKCILYEKKIISDSWLSLPDAIIVFNKTAATVIYLSFFFFCFFFRYIPVS